MIPRPTYVKRIMKYADTPFVKVLSGVRRCGKSTILKMIEAELRGRDVSGDRILSYNFDSLQHEEIKTAKALYDEIKTRPSKDGKTYLFLDEIQEVKDWEKAVNSFMADFDVDIYVTGSNSRMMSSEIFDLFDGALHSVPGVPALVFRVFIFSRGIYKCR